MQEQAEHAAVAIGSHRRFVWVRSDLAQFKNVKDALGGTVNDVVLAVVAGALRDWLKGRGIRIEGLELRAQVPVSIRATDEHGKLGNRLAAMRAPIPVYISDPVRRLTAVSRAMNATVAMPATSALTISAATRAFSPVSVIVAISSQHLKVSGGGRTAQTIAPHRQIAVDVRAEARTSGVFPLDVQLLTPRGESYDAEQLFVRSTAYGSVAILITAGATGVLLLAAVVRLTRRALAARRARVGELGS